MRESLKTRGLLDQRAAYKLMLSTRTCGTCAAFVGVQAEVNSFSVHGREFGISPRENGPTVLASASTQGVLMRLSNNRATGDAREP